MVFVWLVSYASGATGFANQSYGYRGYGGSEGSYENPTGYGYVGSGPNSNIGGEELQNEVVGSEQTLSMKMTMQFKKFRARINGIQMHMKEIHTFSYFTHSSVLIEQKSNS